ncbi:pilus assembly protein TadG-related protein [Siculibacillus lacustris]|uniref:pilus assembly protein TadG-related protein n=1 Tax=Siculibacillus lacustris TaxID=1549641 RepID=UPI002248882D|nr:pilus assembly protein TadG-related protein [Siculibacillus lacustris]
MAVLFALVALPMVVVCGGTLDYIGIEEVRGRCDAAADAAALAAAGRSAIALTAAAAQTQAAGVFTADLPDKIKPVITASQATVTDVGTTRTVTVTYTASVPTTFLRLIGIPTVTLTGSAAAAASLPIYMDFYLLLDNTPSMGVAATTSDIAKMVAATPDQCAFACHDLSDSDDYYALAKRIGVTTRIDVVRTATQQLMDTATATAAVTNQFRMAIYTFGASATAESLTTISALTSNLAAAKTAAAGIDLMTVPYQNYDGDMDTDFDGTLTALNTVIPNPGSGASASVTPQKVLLFVSDGVADAYYPSTCSQGLAGGGRCQEPLNIATCTTIKNRGIKIAVLYTTYLALPTNSWYMTWISPFNAQIAARMKSCASPGLYFEVSPSGGISDAMNALFKSAVQGAWLTR